MVDEQGKPVAGVSVQTDRKLGTYVSNDRRCKGNVSASIALGVSSVGDRNGQFSG